MTKYDREPKPVVNIGMGDGRAQVEAVLAEFGTMFPLRREITLAKQLIEARAERDAALAWQSVDYSQLMALYKSTRDDARDEADTLRARYEGFIAQIKERHRKCCGDDAPPSPFAPRNMSTNTVGADAMSRPACGRCGVVDAAVLDLDTGGAYHPELQGCIKALLTQLAAARVVTDAMVERASKYDYEATVIGAKWEEAHPLLQAQIRSQFRSVLTDALSEGP